MYETLGVRRVINASGIYTDLGGSVLAPAVWAAAAAANATWASMDELLERSGARIAALCGAPAARVVPGASAAIALSVAACVARGDGAVASALPLSDATVLLQREHAYKYARCASLAGARVAFVDDLPAALAAGPAPAAILHPAHLDGEGVPLAALAPAARAAGVPVVVDAAYQSFPLAALARWASAGDLACFSAKYFGGPNGGGFVSGHPSRVADVAALDFTGYESGAFRPFGRAFKLDRSTVVATVAALDAWLAADHAARLRGHAELASALAQRCEALCGADLSLAHFSLEERLEDGPVNAVVLRGAPAEPLAEVLAAGDPSVRALVIDDALVVCTETITPAEVGEIVSALTSAWRRLPDR